jgi:hypothetical protein
MATYIVEGLLDSKGSITTIQLLRSLRITPATRYPYLLQDNHPCSCRNFQLSSVDLAN